MPVRLYTFEDEGAPTLLSASGVSSFQNLRTVLKACLVTGYGGKPPLGWTIGHETENAISFGNGNGFAVFIFSGSASTTNLYAMETITDGTTDLPAGTNRRSGAWFDGNSTNLRQYAYCSGFSTTTAGKGWSLIGDEKTFIVHYGGSTTVDPASNTAGAHYVGEFTDLTGAKNFALLGGGFTTGTTGNFFVAYPTQAGGTALRNPITGLIPQGNDAGYAIGAYTWANVPSVNNVVPLPPGASFQLSRTPLVGFGTAITGTNNVNSQTRLGRLRGVMNSPELAGVFFSNLLPRLGKPQPVWQDRFRPLTLANGKQYLPMWTTQLNLGFFVSIDEADWD